MKDLDTHLTKDDIKMVNKHMKKMLDIISHWENAKRNKCDNTNIYHNS